jgi:flagellar M-ring protein FliF
VDLTKLQAAVSTAAGVDTTRGDALNVTSMPFDQTATKTAAAELKKAEQAQQRAQMIGWAKQAAIVLGILVLLLVVWLSRKKKQTVDELVQLDLVESQVGIPAQRQALEAADRLALPAGDGDSPTPAIPQRRKDDVLALVERQPDEVAELLRGWLADRRG